MGGRWVLTLPRYDAPWYPAPVDGEDWQSPPTDEGPRPAGAPSCGPTRAIEGPRGSVPGRRSRGRTRSPTGPPARRGQSPRPPNASGTSPCGVGRSLWNRRVPTESIARLATLSPLLGRMPVDLGGSALQAIADRTPSLAPALFSSAARRMLRRRGPLDRAAAPGATSLATLISAANRCPDPQSPTTTRPEPRILPNRRETGRSIEPTSLRATHPVLPTTPTWRPAGPNRRRPSDRGRHLPAAPSRRTDCRPMPDLSAFADSIAAGVDPTAGRPVVVERVLGGLTGLREPLLAEPDDRPRDRHPAVEFPQGKCPRLVATGRRRHSSGPGARRAEQSGVHRAVCCWEPTIRPSANCAGATSRSPRGGPRCAGSGSGST